MFKIFSLCLLLLLSPFAQADIPINSSAALITREYNDSSDRLHFDIDLSYPQIEARPLDEASQNFNNYVQHMISLEVERFKALLPTLNQQIVKGSGLDDSKSTLKIDYELNIIWPRNQPIISMLLTIEKFMINDVRPSIYHRSLNYDWQNGKALSLYDIFNETDGFKKFVADYSAEELSETTGLTPTEISTSFVPLTTWNLGPDILSFTFDDFPIPLRTQAVVIPYVSLKQYMKANSALVACWDGETDDCSKRPGSLAQALKKSARPIVAKASKGRQYPG